MLTKADLEWTHKGFSLYSKLMLIPVSFKDPIMGCQMVAEIESTIWRPIGFKLYQISFTLHSLFMSFRTFEYARSGKAGDEDLDFWDFVPVMLFLSGAYLTFDYIVHLIFDSSRAMNTKIYNEILKLFGKNLQVICVVSKKFIKGTFKFFF